MIKEYLLQLTLPNWIFALLVIALGGLAFAYYFRTLPPLSSLRRIIVTVLRGLAMIILLFLILEPMLRLLYQNREKPVVGVLLDNSASMKIEENNGLRGDSLRFVRDQIAAFAGRDSLDIRTFAFDLQTRQIVADSLKFDVDGSDLTQALNAAMDTLSGNNLQALVLVSDGVYNRGANPVLPAQNLPVPVFTVLIGDSTEPKDVALRRVQTNQITYVGKTLPVTVTFWHNGYDGQNAVLSLSDGNRRLAQKTVRLGRSGFEQKETLEITADRPGELNLTARIQPLGEEVTDRNNQQFVRVQVLKSKLKVLVMSGAPNFDRQALSFVGRQLTDFDFEYLTELNNGRYFEERFESVKTDSLDLLIFHGFPTSRTSSAHLNTLMQAVRDRQIPVMWLPNRNANYQSLGNFSQMLPFDVRGNLAPQPNQFVRLTGNGRLHPALKLEENEGANALLWRELPPVSIFPQIRPKEGAQPLFVATEDNSDDEITAGFAYRQNETKHLVLNAANFSNWHYQLQEDPNRDRFFIRLMERAVRWLASRDDIQQIQIQPLQRSFNVGEAAVFAGQVYDAFYQPVSDARVVVTITGDSVEFSDEMVPEGNGYYRQSFSGLPEGQFSYRVEARRNDQRIGVRNGSFAVNPFFLEFQQIPANQTLMQQLATVTGGKAFSPAEFVREFPQQQFRSRVQINHTEHFLWRYWHWLAALVLFLGIEWFLRKRWGML